MFHRTIGAAVAGALLLAGGAALADHGFVLEGGPVGAGGATGNGPAESRGARAESAADAFLPWTTDGRTPVGVERAKDLAPIGDDSSLRDSRK